MKHLDVGGIKAWITRHWLMLAYLTCLAALLLAPFKFESPIVANGARWVSGAGLEFETPGIVRSKAPPAWLAGRLARGDGFTLEVWAAGGRNSPQRHARIVSYSRDLFARNFTLGQQGRDLIVRLRTTRTDGNALHPFVRLKSAFGSPTVQHIVVTYDFARQRIYIDGRRRFDLATPGGNLSNWDPGHYLVLGNEATGGRSWLGGLHFVAIYERALRAREIERLFAAGAGSQRRTGRRDALVIYDFTGAKASFNSGRPVALEMPRHLIKGSDNFLQWPHYAAALSAEEKLEILANVLLFLPLGLLLYRSAHADPGGPWKRAATVLVIGALTTLCFESIQFFLPGRTSSLVDALANTSGAALGVAVGAWCSQLRAKPPA